MKRLMDGIVNALKKINHEKSQFNDIYRIYASASIGQDDYYNPDNCNSR